ncbi:hypothetical protein SAMN05444338_1276 [Flavobacterium degerlachei]|jgi:hypothetical protein|uniref:Uncharacterized protein n=1 Tax=Flavobacterium degerlachei TaxID=229203 RepID=A0A1H3GSR1_9FLAO|nr:hypothetical protein SAMN05444338_1276 [Flavobacterium degerlachei]
MNFKKKTKQKIKKILLKIAEILINLITTIIIEWLKMKLGI